MLSVVNDRFKIAIHVSVELSSISKRASFGPSIIYVTVSVLNSDFILYPLFSDKLSHALMGSYTAF